MRIRFNVGYTNGGDPARESCNHFPSVEFQFAYTSRCRSKKLTQQQKSSEMYGALLKPWLDLFTQLNKGGKFLKKL